jgi:hypothetical protein
MFVRRDVGKIGTRAWASENLHFLTGKHRYIHRPRGIAAAVRLPSSDLSRRLSL